MQGFLQGTRGRDANNWGPRVGFNWTPGGGRTSVHGGYGLYYDRVTLQIQSLERGLDGRALPIEVRAGSAMFVDPSIGRFAPGAPTMADPFTGFILPGAGASGINIIDNRLQNPQVQQFNLGIERALPADVVLRVDGIHNLGTHFIIGRTLGAVFNPVVGGPDRVVNLESSARTKYGAPLVSVEQRRGRQFTTGAGLNAYLRDLNDRGGIGGTRLPLVRDDVRFNDGFSSLDVRVSRRFRAGAGLQVEPMLEIFNLFNVTSLLAPAKPVRHEGRAAGRRTAARPIF